MDKKNNLFCALAWMHSFVNNDGFIQVCCTGEEFDNVIRDNNHNPFQIRQDPSVEEVVNSNYMKDLRLKMMAGNLPEICKRCVEQEAAGALSRRQIENRKYQKFTAKLIDETKEDGSIPVEIRSIDYRLGNFCNLQCRMCHPKASKNWVGDYLRLKAGLIDGNSNYSPESYQLTSSEGRDFILEDFEKKLDFLEDLHFGGGEPLVSPTMTKILEKCVELKISKRITLSYNTNLTVLPEKILELWKEFKGVELLVSIDAHGQLNNYIRYPSQWEDIDKNLKFLDNNFEKFSLRKIEISATVQMNNILHLPELFKYTMGFKNVRKFPNLVPILNPQYMQIHFLPTGLKQEAYIKLKKLMRLVDLNSNEIGSEEAIKGIRHIVSALGKKETMSFFWKMSRDFAIFTERFDKDKGLDYKDYNPEFSVFFE